jgi:3',5'-cyclic AMP phosphodiesterase CpdA
VRVWLAVAALGALAAWLILGCMGCAAAPGRLKYVASTVAAVPKDTLVHDYMGRSKVIQTWRPMFSDTLIGLVPGTGDSSRRFLGRLRGGYTADTLNFIIFGDNRPGWRATRLQPEWSTLHRAISANPVNWVRGLLTIPVILVKGLYPDFALVRDAHHKILNMPDWGRERQVVSAMLARVDSLRASGQEVSAVINTGDLVEDGRVPQHWERFLRISAPLYTRVPYFAVAGNHERTDTELGVANWRTATGLPVGGDRLYYCFDSADGWVRFIALDTNPIVDPSNHWTRAVQVRYSDEQFSWLVDRVKEHRGPVLVMMHHPPFSAGFHRDEWQRDPVLRERRARMVRALHESGISILASGHEHAYQRALLRWPDAVMIAIMTGGGGAPLHDVPTTAVAAPVYAAYKVAGAEMRPQDVLTAKAFNFVLMRLWFGGGEFYAYAVDNNAKASLIDKVQVDLKRYGVPKIDQHKIPIAPQKGPSEPVANEQRKPKTAAKADSVTASRRLLSKPAPGKKAPRAPHGSGH